jgi:hypothetical protein
MTIKPIPWQQWLLLAGLALAAILIPFPAVAAAPTDRTFHILQASLNTLRPFFVSPGDGLRLS